MNDPVSGIALGVVIVGLALSTFVTRTSFLLAGSRLRLGPSRRGGAALRAGVHARRHHRARHPVAPAGHGLDLSLFNPRLIGALGGGPVAVLVAQHHRLPRNRHGRVHAGAPVSVMKAGRSLALTTAVGRSVRRSSSTTTTNDEGVHNAKSWWASGAPGRGLIRDALPEHGVHCCVSWVDNWGVGIGNGIRVAHDRGGRDPVVAWAGQSGDDDGVAAGRLSPSGRHVPFAGSVPPHAVPRKSLRLRHGQTQPQHRARRRHRRACAGILPSLESALRHARHAARAQRRPQTHRREFHPRAGRQGVLRLPLASL